MDAGGTPVKQVTALCGGVIDAHGPHCFIVMTGFLEARAKVLRNACATHRGEALDLAEIGDGHYPCDDGHVYAAGTRAFDEGEVVGVVKEQLGDDELQTAVNLVLEMGQIALAVAALNMALGVARTAKAELKAAFANKLHQLSSKAKAIRWTHERGLIARWIATQCQYVLDAGGRESFEHGVDFIAACTHAGQVRHRLDANLVFDAPHQLEGLVACAAAGAIGDRHKRWPQFSQSLDGLIQALFPSCRLGRKKLEGERRTVTREQIVDAHAVA